MNTRRCVHAVFPDTPNATHSRLSTVESYMKILYIKKGVPGIKTIFIFNRMKLTELTISSLLLASIFFHNNAMAQADQIDSTYYQSAVNNAMALYQQSEKDQSRLMNGREYKPYTFRFVKGFPFFLTKEFSESSIHYDGGFYDHVQLMYDEITELVILNKGIQIELANERIKEFTIAGHRFLPLAKDSVNNLPASGFYESLYKGKIEMYKKEKKSIVDILSPTDGYQAEASARSFYYLKKGEQFYPVKRRRDMLRVLNNKKNEIQQYIKQNRLDFKRDKDNTLAKIGAYYDQMTP